MEKKEAVAIDGASETVRAQLMLMFDLQPWGTPDVSFALLDMKSWQDRSAEMGRQLKAYREAKVPIVALFEGVPKAMHAIIKDVDAAFLFGDACSMSSTDIPIPCMEWEPFPDYGQCFPHGPKQEAVLHLSDAFAPEAYAKDVLRGAIAHRLTILADAEEKSKYPLELRSFCVQEVPAGAPSFAVMSFHVEQAAPGIEMAMLSAAARLQRVALHGKSKVSAALGDTFFFPESARELDAHIQLTCRYPQRLRPILLSARRKAFGYRSPYMVYNFLHAHGLLARSRRHHIAVISEASNEAQAQQALCTFSIQTHPAKTLYLIGNYEAEAPLPDGVHVLSPHAFESNIEQIASGYCARFDSAQAYDKDYLKDMLCATWSFSAFAIAAQGASVWQKTESVCLNTGLVLLDGMSNEVRTALLRGETVSMPAMQIDTDQLACKGAEVPAILHGSSLSPASARADVSNCDYLVVTNRYPTEDSPYANMFTHQRVKSYLDVGNLRVAVFSFEGGAPGKLSHYEYDGVHVATGEINELLTVLTKHRPHVLLLHMTPSHVLQKIANGGIDIPAILWMHGAESYPASARSYIFVNQRKLSELCISHHGRNVLMKKLAENPKVGFVPVSRTLQDDVQKLYGLALDNNRTNPIHNYVNDVCYAYIPKAPEARFHIVSVKNYSTYTYAGDLLAQVILSLSERDIFSKLSFTIYGQGILFQEQTLALAAFENVSVNEGFLPPEVLAALYQANGILLMPTRHDTQGVSRDEAMACGVVPITSRVGAIPEFVDDSCAIITEPENVVQMADAIETLCKDEDRFLRLSENAAKHVRKTCGFSNTIQREIDWIQSFESQCKETSKNEN